MKTIDTKLYQITTDEEVEKLKKGDLSVLPELNITDEEYQLLKRQIRPRMIFRRDQGGRLKLENVDGTDKSIYEVTITKEGDRYYCFIQNFKL